MKYLLLFFVFSTVYAVNLNCSSSIIQYYAPQNLSQITTYPANSNDTLSPNQICRFHFNVPTGYSVFLVFSASLSNGSVTVVDSINVSKIYRNAFLQPSFLISPGGTVYVQTSNAVGYFNLQFKYYKYNTYPINHTISPSAKDPFYLNTQISQPTTFYASTRVSLVTIPQIEQYISYLQATAVFDGSSVNSKYIGSLYDQYISGNQFVSSGRYLTLYTVASTSYSAYGSVIIQDYSITSKFGKFVGVSMENAPLSLTLSSPSTSQPVAFITTMGTTNAEYLIAANASTNAKIDVYIGSVFDDRKIATYNISNVNNSLPQEFLGIHRTYVVTNGQVTMKLGRRTIESGFQNAYIGRKGFIASRYYKTSGLASPTVTSDVLAPQKTQNFGYKLNIGQLDLSRNNSLIIENGDVTNVYNSSNKIASSLTVYGPILSVQYSGDATTSGFYMDFEIVNGNLSKSIFCSLLLFFVANFRF